MDNIIIFITIGTPSAVRQQWNNTAAGCDQRLSIINHQFNLPLQAGVHIVRYLFEYSFIDVPNLDEYS